MDVKLTVGKHNIRVMSGPYTQGSDATEAASQFARELIDLLPEMKTFAAKELLKTYNDSWIDDGHAEMTSSQFQSNLISPDIVIFDELGAATVYFSDSDMFGGHLIDVSVYDGNIKYASLVG